QPAGGRHHRQAGRDYRPEGGRTPARRRRRRAVERHAHAAVVPSAAHIDHLEEDVRGDQQPDPVGRGLEHGPMGAEAMSDPAGQDISEVIATLTREVSDFPSPGIQFKDLTPLLADPDGLAAVTDALAEIASGAELIAGVDARGFLLGGAVATRLGTGVLA